MKKFIDKADELGITYSHLYTLCLRKQIEFIVVCGKYYFK